MYCDFIRDYLSPSQETDAEIFGDKRNSYHLLSNNEEKYKYIYRKRDKANIAKY